MGNDLLGKVAVKFLEYGHPSDTVLKEGKSLLYFSTCRMGLFVFCCCCNPILITMFPECLSGKEPWPRISRAVGLSSLCFACTCTVLAV